MDNNKANATAELKRSWNIVSRLQNRTQTEDTKVALTAMAARQAELVAIIDGVE
jgi:hypothetical protein